MSSAIQIRTWEWLVRRVHPEPLDSRPASVARMFADLSMSRGVGDASRVFSYSHQTNFLEQGGVEVELRPLGSSEPALPVD